MPGERSARRLSAAMALACATAAGAVAEPSWTAQLSLDRLLPGGARERVAADPAAGVPFLIRFTGGARGLEPGAAVEINGMRVGAVRGTALEYEPQRNRFVLTTAIALQPDLLPIMEGRRPRTAEEAVAAMDALVRAGLRVRLASARPLGGEATVALVILPDAPPETLRRTGDAPEIPAAPTQTEEAGERIQQLLDRVSRAPVEEMIADLQQAMAALRSLATGPELREALAGLREASAELRTQIARISARTDPILASLNETVRTANRTIERAGQTLVSLERQFGDRSPLIGEAQTMLREMNGAARSMRLMADYLERNPDALLRGKSDSRR
jgi:paraquat-inducible protein B